jgi:light-regulated signal transduction histidine kinase (bacteriophytochrome)
MFMTMSAHTVCLYIQHSSVLSYLHRHETFCTWCLSPKSRQQGESVIKGHGIGLAIVKRILDWHQGEIHIGQCPQLAGAQFIITLPTSM